MISFVVAGVPRPQGSKKPIVVKGKARLIEQNDALQKTWRGDILDAIERWKEACPEVAAACPLTGPVVLEVAFFLRRPPSVSAIKRPKPDVAPDCSKLIRALEDCVTIAGLWHDDAQVTDLHVKKRYAPAGEVTGARVAIRPVPPEIP